MSKRTEQGRRPDQKPAPGTALGRGRPGGLLRCSSALSSTNLGHTEVGWNRGFIKTLAVQHGQIPPNQHFETGTLSIPLPTCG